MSNLSAPLLAAAMVKHEIWEAPLKSALAVLKIAREQDLAPIQSEAMREGLMVINPL